MIANQMVYLPSPVSGQFTANFMAFCCCQEASLGVDSPHFFLSLGGGWLLTSVLFPPGQQGGAATAHAHEASAEPHSGCSLSPGISDRVGWCLSQTLCDGWYPWATFDDWQARRPRRLVGSPEGASALVVGNFSTLMPSWRPGCRSQVLPTPQLRSIPKCSGRGEKGVSLFCRFSQSWRADAHSQALTFLWVETAGQECFSWSPAVCCEGRGDEGNGKLFP